jgi:poly(hydroxyalkanoate) depolymerase family esterase
MDFDLARAMREAAELTRASKLAEATRVIQDALAGRSSVGSTLPGTATPDPGGPTETPRRIDQAAPQVEPAPRGGERAQSAHSAEPHASGRLGPRLRRSLGDVVRTLRQARLRGLAPGPLPGVAPRATPRLPEGAQFLTRSFTGRAGSRVYKLYLPRGRPARGLPLLVMLHGCTQDPDDFAIGSRMNSVAEEFGFLVAYPGQPRTANPSSCWNWFAPKDQQRGAGEPSLIAGLTTDIVAQYQLDPDRIFVAGLSAGGAMATVMGATYPDVYAAVGVHSGLAYGAATDVVSAFAAMRGDAVPGSRADAGSAGQATRVRAIVLHGDADVTVHPANAARIVEACDRRDGDVREVRSGMSGGRAYTRTTIRSQGGPPRTEPLAHPWCRARLVGRQPGRQLRRSGGPRCLPRDGAFLPRGRGDLVRRHAGPG